MKDLTATDFDQLLVKLNACKIARIWAKGKTLAEVLATCERADWLLWLMGRLCGTDGWPDLEAIVLVACDCAEIAFKYVQAAEERPRIAIETARKWVNGEVALSEVWKAAKAAKAAAATAAAYAADAAYAAYAAAAAADAAAAAYAADAADDAAYAAAAYAADAADDAAYAAAADADAATHKKAHEDCLKIIRKAFSVETDNSAQCKVQP